MKYGYIYIIKNTINEKVYIGQTSISAEERFKSHLKLLQSNSKQLIYKAIKKYGKDKFYIETLQTCLLDELDEKEEFWIEKYKSFGKGYNLCAGGKQPRRQPVKTIFDEDIKKICFLYNEGKSTRYIEETLNISRWYITRIIKNNNILIRSKSHKLKVFNKISKDELLKQLSLNISMRKIAKNLLVSESAIRKAIKRFKINIVEYKQ